MRKPPRAHVVKKKKNQFITLRKKKKVPSFLDVLILNGLLFTIFINDLHNTKQLRLCCYRIIKKNGWRKKKYICIYRYTHTNNNQINMYICILSNIE